MEEGVKGWWSRHGWTLLVLLSAFSLSFLVRSVWNIPLFQEWGATYLFAGGSDSFYHWRVSSFIILNHRNLVLDPLLKYPTGAANPREPLFDWMNALVGMLLAPFFRGSAAAAGRFSLELAGPLWAALSVFPLYLIGKEVGSRRMGLIAVLIWPFLVANIDSSTFAYANYLSFYTFFILVMLYAYLRTIRAAGSRKFVESYRDPKGILGGVRTWARVEALGVRWAVFTGVAFGAVILAWQGYTFLVAIVVVFLVVQMIIERIRRVDSLGLYLSTWIVGIVGFPMAFPYYYIQNDYRIWFLEPVLIYFGALLILLPFVLLRDAPWVISIPVLVGTAGATIGGVALLAPTTFADLVSGQGYFVKTLIYTTVAEAQAPSIDALIIGYGVVTFFLAFAGVAFVIYQLARGRFQRRHLLFLVFGVVSIYLPISAAKFFYLGSAAFSLLPAEALSRMLDIGGYPTLRRNVASLSDRRSQLGALRRSFKARHVLVLLLMLAIVLPNVWYAADAGVPYNSKSALDNQIYNSLPTQLRVSPTNASSYYLGAAGSQIDTPNQYDEAGYDWLATQDTNLPPAQRPALVSWWDYGFQTISEGDHPAVADNFQNGIDPSGNFLLAQNESLAIGVLSATLLSAEESVSGHPYLPNDLNARLASDGVDLATLHTLLVNESADEALVLAHPGEYLPVDPAHLTGDNAMYDTVSYFLATSLSLASVAKVYDDIQAYTGWTIRYAMVDSRLIPFSGSNTGIFYAPADLTDRVISSGGEPVTYFNVTIVGSDGNSYPAGQIPAGVTPTSYNIAYNSPFYDSMIYRIYFGFNGTDVGQSNGIPGISGSVGGDNVAPGWMLQHFEVVYRTAYACHQANATPGSTCFAATNVPTARALAASHNGTADTSDSSYFSGGEAILAYYPGESVTGVVRLPNGAPVPNARVTVYDAWGIPHMTTVSGSDGSYALVLPPGNDTLNVTTGTVNLLTQAGSNLLGSFNESVPAAVGFSTVGTTATLSLVLKPSTVQGVVYFSPHNDSSYDPYVDQAVLGAAVTIWGHGLSNRTATTDASGAFVMTSVPPSVYNVSVRVGSSTYTEPVVSATPGKTVNISGKLPIGGIRAIVDGPNGRPLPNATVAISSYGGGVIARGLTNASGVYAITDIGEGNFTVSASVASLGWGALPVAASLSRAGANASVSVQVGPISTVSVTVLKAGRPAIGLPVRFTQIVQPTMGPVAPATPSNATGVNVTTQAKAPSAVAVTDAEGVATLTLPSGNYSLYALGLNQSGYVAGFWSGEIGFGAPAPPALVVSTAQRLYGAINASGAPQLASPPEVAVYDGAGHEVFAFGNITRYWSIWLPEGRYTIDSFETTPPAQAWVQTVVLSNTTFLYQQLTPASIVTGSVLSSTTALPVVGAHVVVDLAPHGGPISATTVSSGAFSVVVPTSPIFGPDTLYCVNVSAPGYASSSSCGIQPVNLQTLAPIELTATSVPLALTLPGPPAGTPVTVNLTAAGEGAQSRTVTGLSPLTVAVLPGLYTVSASASASSSGRWLPAAPISLDVGIGEGALTLNVPLLRQVPVVGSLSLPSGASLSHTSVRLYSSSMSVSVNGPAYEAGIYAAPGSYTYDVSVPSANGLGGWSSYGSLVVPSGPATLPSIAVNRPSLTLSGSATLPNNSPLNQTVSLTFTSPDGYSFPVTAPSGSLSVLLPTNVAFSVALNLTTTVPVGNLSIRETLRLPAGLQCTANVQGATCPLLLVATPINATLSGTTVIGSSGLALAAQLVAIGPSPSARSVAFSSNASGGFEVALSPGSYLIDTTAAGGAYAALTPVTIGTSDRTGLRIDLATAWTATVTVEPPTGESVGALTLSFAELGGPTLVLADAPLERAIAVALPPGSYAVNASAPSNPYGVPTNATASAPLILRNGNGALTLDLVESLTPSVDIKVNWGAPGVAAVTLPASGGTVSYPFTVRNIGNLPVSFTVVGGPAFWNFTISPKNFSLTTLGVGSQASGTVIARVPGGTPQVHAALSLTAHLAGSNRSIGTSFPKYVPPPIEILANPGVSLGLAKSLAPTVTPLAVSFPIFVRNTGNFGEGIALSVADGARLAQLGWTTSLYSGSALQTKPLYLAASANQSLTLDLNASGSAAIPPGALTLSAVVVNQSANGYSTSVVLGVPIASLGLGSNGSSLVITGPGIGSPSPYPDWVFESLVFLPALAIVVVALVHRWRKTRTWVR